RQRTGDSLPAGAALPGPIDSVGAADLPATLLRGAALVSTPTSNERRSIIGRIRPTPDRPRSPCLSGARPLPCSLAHYRSFLERYPCRGPVPLRPGDPRF